MQIVRKVESEYNIKEVADKLLSAYFNFLSNKLPLIDLNTYKKCTGDSSRVIELFRAGVWRACNSKYAVGYTDMSSSIEACSFELQKAFDMSKVHYESDKAKIIQYCIDKLVYSRNKSEGVKVNG